MVKLEAVRNSRNVRTCRYFSRSASFVGFGLQGPYAAHCMPSESPHNPDLQMTSINVSLHTQRVCIQCMSWMSEYCFSTLPYTSPPIITYDEASRNS